VSGEDTLSPQLEGLRREFQAAGHNVEELLAGMTEEEFRTRIRPEQWSVGECLGHLNAVARLYQPVLERAIEEGREKGYFGTGPFGHGVMGWLSVRLMEPPPRFRLPAPRPFQPVDHGPLREVKREFDQSRERFVAALDDAGGLDLSRIKVASPASALVRLNLAAAFAFLAAHERRHLWQARQVRRALGISSS